jgi:hypothetical protein
MLKAPSRSSPFKAALVILILLIGYLRIREINLPKVKINSVLVAGVNFAPTIKLLHLIALKTEIQNSIHNI